MVFIPNALVGSAYERLAFSLHELPKQLKNINDVRDVHIKPYDYKASLNFVLGYCGKLETNKSSRSQTDTYVGKSIYPYDFDVNCCNKKGRCNDKIKSFTDKRYNNALDRFVAAPNLFFSDKYNEIYYDEMIEMAVLLK